MNVASIFLTSGQSPSNYSRLSASQTSMVSAANSGRRSKWALAKSKTKGRWTIVQMRLLVNGSSIAITQTGPDFLFIEPTGAHAACDATILLKVDDNERQWQVRLPEGI